jgi:hypothetical protein
MCMHIPIINIYLQKMPRKALHEGHEGSRTHEGSHTHDGRVQAGDSCS